MTAILKIYSCAALIGVILVLAYGVVSEFPNATGVLVLVIGGFYIATRLMAGLLNRVTPPTLADITLYLLLPTKNGNLILDDLQQIYQSRLDVSRPEGRTLWQKYLARLRVDAWYWVQVLKSVRPLILLRLRSVNWPAEVNVNLRCVLPFYQNY